MKVHDEDRGLDAVRRVRSSRENDSRVGLQHALGESQARTAAAAAAAAALSSARTFAAGSSMEFQQHRRQLSWLAQDQQRTDQVATRTANIAEEARHRWLRDRTAVHSVDLLLQRRADERRADRARREAAELDDLSASRWLRALTADDEGSTR